MNEELKIIISAEVAKLKKGVDEAKKKVSKFKEEVAKASKNVDTNFKTIGTSMAKGVKAAATAFAAAGAALFALGASTQEYRNEQAKLITAFEAAGGTAAEAKETYNDLFRVLGDSGQATEAASHIAKLTTEEKALSEWTNICQGVYATFGASLPIESLTEAANETAKTGALTGSLADALNWAGVNEAAFTESLEACNTEAEREALIRETLSGLYSDAAAKYEENNAQVLAQRDAQARLQETTAKLGEAIAPVITAFTNFANDALAIVTPYVQSLAEKYMPTLKETLDNVSGAMQTAFEWASQHKELLAAIAIVVGIVATAIGAYNAVQAIKTALDITGTLTVGALTTALWANVAAMAAAIAPYLLVVAAIAAVIAIIVVCVKHWDQIKAAVAKAWSFIKEKTVAAVDSVKSKFTEMKNNITEKVNAVKSTISNTFENIKNSITDKINAAKNTVKNVIDAIKGFFKFEWSLPKLKMPHISISGEFSLVPPKVPSFSIDWYARGGVFDKPTLFGYGGSLGGLGEAGAEAVVPLERNLGWLDKLATMLSEKQGVKPIYLVVDKRIIGQVSADGINEITRATGVVPIKVM